MILRKKFKQRLKKADFYMLFIIDDEGVGYCSQSSKKGVSGDGIRALISRMEKERDYAIGILNSGKVACYQMS